MRLTLLRVALVAILAGLIGCGVSDGDIDHWKRTQRGPGKIAAVLVGTRYDQSLRVHAARALIEMHHPNANGLDLLVSAMNTMTPSDREAIIHALLEPLRSQMRGADQQQTASGPGEQQIRAKDAAYLLLRFAAPADRVELANELLTWLLADLNSRALAGQYTAEQIVTAIGPSAVDRLNQAFTSNEDAIRVAINIAQLINGVGTDAGKDGAVTALLRVTREIAGPAATDRLRATATQLLARGADPNNPPSPARIASATEGLRGQYLTILYEGLHILARPAGTQYLISVAADAAVPLERRKAVLSAVANQVHANDADALLAIANNTTAPTDIELRGLAVDRLGEARSQTSLTALWQLFDTTNGGEEGNEYTLRWKVGEAILKIGGPNLVSTFVEHLARERHPVGTPPVAFAGYTFAELNGFALGIGDFSPPPRDAMRALLAHPNAYVRTLALLFLAAKGDASDDARIGALANDAAPLAGPGWQQAQQQTVGAVATHARDTLHRTLTTTAPGSPAS